MKKNVNTFITEIYSKPPMRNYETKKIIFNHFDEKWSIDLAGMIDFRTSKNKICRYLYVDI